MDVCIDRLYQLQSLPWENRRRELENLLAAPNSGDHRSLQALSEELAELLETIAAAEERWLVLSELPS